jgi:parallel beta-helix repeat protein
MSAQPALTLLAVSAMLLSMAGAYTPPPSSGDWTIWDVTMISGQTITLNGNLIVQRDGLLVLNDSTLTMNCQNDGQYIIDIQKGGELRMNNTTVTSASATNHYKFQIHGKATITHSTVEEVWGTANWGDAGLFIDSDGVTLYCTTVRSCPQTGITLFDSDASIVNCTIYNNSVRGILCYGATSGEILNNIIHNNGNNGINQGDYSSAQIRNNTIFNHSITGINIYNHASPTIKDNIIYDIMAMPPKLAVGINDWGDKDSKPWIENNTLWDCKIGIDIDVNSMAYIFDNKIKNCAKNGISVTGNATPTIEKNVISNISENGIYNEQNSCATLLNNDVTNCVDGIFNTDNATPTISGNTISDNQNGITSYNSSKPIIYNNMIYNNQNDGIVNDFDCVADIRNNTIYGNAGTGVRNKQNCNVSLVNNSITNNTDGILNIDSVHASILQENIISNNIRNGIKAENHATVTIENSTARDNKLDGVACLDDCVLVISGNKISGNGGNGISGDGRCYLNVTENELSDNNINLKVRACNGNLSQNKIVGGVHGIELYETSVNISASTITDGKIQPDIGIYVFRANSTMDSIEITLTKDNCIGCQCLYGSSPRIINTTMDFLDPYRAVEIWAAKDSHPKVIDCLKNINKTYFIDDYDNSTITVYKSFQLNVIDHKERPLDNADVTIEGMEPFDRMTYSNGSTPWRVFETETLWKQNYYSMETWKTYQINITKDDDSDLIENKTFEGDNCSLIFDYRPVIAPIPVITVNEDAMTPFDLSIYISDRDHDLDQLRIYLISGSVAGGHIVIDGMTLWLFYDHPCEDDILYLNVSDGIRTTTFQVTVHINAINDDPRYIGPTTLVLNESESRDLDVGDYIVDEDSNLSEFNLSYENRCNDYITQVNLTLTFKYPNGVTSDNVQITIRGYNNTQCIAIINVTIIPVNDPPVILPFPQLTTNEDTKLDLNLNGRAVDEEDLPSQLAWRVENISKGLIDVTIDERNVMTITPLPNLNGNATFTLIVRDSGGLEAMVNVTVKILPINDPPVFRVNQSFYVVAGSRTVVPIRDKIDDPDSPIEKIRIGCTSPYVTFEGNNIIFNYPRNWSSGADWITITLTDDGGANTTYTDIPVNVTPMDKKSVPIPRYPNELFILVPLALVAGVAAILAFRRYKYGWYEIKRAFLVYQDGRMLAHYGEKADADDEMLVSSMLTAVQQFIEEAMKKDQAGAIQEFQYEDMKIAVEKGRRLFLAVILKGYTTDNLRKQMKEIVTKIESKHEKALKEWDGRMTKLPLIEEAVAELKKLAGKKATK